MPASASDPYDLAVIGAGPAGLAGAVTAAGLRACASPCWTRRRSPAGSSTGIPRPASARARPEALHHDWRCLRASCADACEQQRRQPPVRTPCLGGRPRRTDGRLGGARRHRGRRRRRSGRRAVRGPRGPARHRRATSGNCPSPAGPCPVCVGAGGAQAMLKAGLVLPGRRRRRRRHRAAAAAGRRGRWPPRAPRRRPWSRPPATCGTPAGPARSLRQPAASSAEAAGYGAALLRHRVPAAHRAARSSRRTAPTGWRPSPSPGSTATGGPCPAPAGGSRATPSPSATASSRRSSSPPHSAAPPATGGRDVRPGPGRRPAHLRARRLGGGRDQRRRRRAARPAPKGELAGPVGRRHGCTGTPPASGAPRLPAAGTGCAPSPTRWPPPTRPAPGWTGWLTDDTVVCRCEEVTGRARPRGRRRPRRRATRAPSSC